MKILVTALRIEKYIGKEVKGHNCDFTYEDAEMTRMVILGLNDNQKVEITLHEEQGECGSGWCSASWGYHELRKVDKFNGYTHKIKKQVEIYFDEQDDIQNEVFSVSYNGGCDYYPGGSFHVNMELFRENGREMKIRPTYIFIGDSGIGKSTLASKFNEDVIVFETDSFETLPKTIVADIIVIGKKYNHTIKDIENSTQDTQLISCSFLKL